MRIIAKTFQGLEEVLEQEVGNLGGSKIQRLTRAVAFDGSRFTLYAANLFLRTALRIVVPILETQVCDEEEIYRAVYDIDWPSYFNLSQTFAVFGNTSSSRFTHSKYIALKVKDAIADRFRSEMGSRPNVSTITPDFRIDVHIRHDMMTISLDSSGDSLHMRGYRKSTVPAPLNEVMAAGLLLHSGWNGEIPFYDPMCGSGTLLTEAWLLASGIMPQREDRHFSFKNWKDFDPALYKRVIREYKPIVKIQSPAVIGSDISSKAVEASLANLKIINAIGVEVIKKDFFNSSRPFETGFLMVNPPYDKRLKENDINQFYSKIGDVLKKEYTGWKAGIFSGNEQAIKQIGLKPSRRISLMNGPIPSKFFIFDLYEGNKKS